MKNPPFQYLNHSDGFEMFRFSRRLSCLYDITESVLIAALSSIAISDPKISHCNQVLILNFALDRQYDFKVPNRVIVLLVAQVHKAGCHLKVCEVMKVNNCIT